MKPVGIEYREDKANGTCTLQNLTEQRVYYLQVDSYGHIHTGDLAPKKSMTLQGVVKDFFLGSVLGKNTTETEERYYNIQLLVNNLVKELDETTHSIIESTSEPKKVEFEVVEDPNIQLGLPTIKGTRWPVRDIVELVEVDGLEDTLSSFRSLNEDMINFAIKYAKQHPEVMSNS